MNCDIQCLDVTVDDLANSFVDDDVLVFHIYKLYIYLSYLLLIHSIVYVPYIEDITKNYLVYLIF